MVALHIRQACPPLPSTHQQHPRAYASLRVRVETVFCSPPPPLAPAGALPQDLEALSPFLSSRTLSSSSSSAAVAATAAPTAAAAASGVAQTCSSLLVDAERRLVGCFLAAACRAPAAALPGVELIVALGGGTGDVLLKQLDGLMPVSVCGGGGGGG